MARRLQITQDARQDVDEIADRIHADKPLAASRWLDQIASRFATIVEAPGIGTAREEFASQIRSVPFGNYQIFFRPIDDDTIEIVRVIDGHRDLRHL